MYKEIDEQYLERLSPIFDKVTEFARMKDDEWDEEKERPVYETLVNTFDELQNDSVFLNILIVTEKQEIIDFSEELKASKNHKNWVWGDWADFIRSIMYDLEGDFEFNSYNAEESYNLKGSSLEATRIANRHYDLDFTLHNVGSIKISREKNKGSHIQVEIEDIDGRPLAEWEEYKKTTKVGLVRLSSNHYRYEYRG